MALLCTNIGFTVTKRVFFGLTCIQRLDDIKLQNQTLRNILNSVSRQKCHQFSIKDKRYYVNLFRRQSLTQNRAVLFLLRTTIITNLKTIRIY